MKFKLFASLFLLIQFANAALTQTEQQKSREAEINNVPLPGIVVDQGRLKRQNGYGMWNNGGAGGGGGGNFPMGNWNGPNSNGYGGPAPPPPDDSIKGSVGTKVEKPAGENQNQNSGQPNGEGQEPWWPNGNGPNGPNGYNNGLNPNGNFPNGYNNGPNPFNGGNNNKNVEEGIKGSIGAAVEPTKPPFPPNGYGYGNRFGNGYGNNNNFGFNRMAGGGGGYGNSFGRPILPRGERFFKGRGQMRY
uniref:DUF148 domain-containing protein n=1 Tax=Caenorhabditis tropicalis TaxID=1561998 RepID=A0A1I7SXE3_9PELO